MARRHPIHKDLRINLKIETKERILSLKGCVARKNLAPTKPHTVRSQRKMYITVEPVIQKCKEFFAFLINKVLYVASLFPGTRKTKNTTFSKLFKAILSGICKYFFKLVKKTSTIFVDGIICILFMYIVTKLLSWASGTVVVHSLGIDLTPEQIILLLDKLIDKLY